MQFFSKNKKQPSNEGNTFLESTHQLTGSIQNGAAF
tara:strand:- start:4492 stop:4599 length:108 start_codon:yes stop_codon:yes gene_type:complete